MTDCTLFFLIEESNELYKKKIFKKFQSIEKVNGIKYLGLG